MFLLIRILYERLRKKSRIRIRVYIEELNALKNKERIKEIYNRQVDRVYRTAMVFMKNNHDAEDIVQSVFLTMIEKNIEFDSPEHEKAWFIVTTRNRCKDILKSYWRKSVDLTDEDAQGRDIADSESNEDSSVTALEVLMSLPEMQREIVFLHYYEGYSVKEVAEMMELSESKVRSGIASAKRSLDKLPRR